MNAITPITNWHAQLPDYLRDEAAVAQVATLGAAFESRAFARVSTEDNRFSLVSEDGTAMPVNQLDPQLGTSFIDVAFLNWSPTVSKAWYAEEYVKGSDASPACSSTDGVRPDAASPQRQADVCATCPHNAFGSARNGRGKACSDSQRTAVMLVADTPVILDGAAHVLKAGESVFGYKLPPMTGKNLRDKVKEANKAGVNFKGVKLRARFVAQGEVGFEFLGYVDAAGYERAKALATSEEADRACGLNMPVAAAPALPAPPAHLAIAAPTLEQTVAAAEASFVQPAPAPVYAPPAPAPVAAAAPAPAPSARKPGRPKAAPPVAAVAPAPAPTPAPADPFGAFGQAGAVAAQPAAAAIIPQAQAAPAPAPQPQVIMQPAAASPELDALLAAAMA